MHVTNICTGININTCTPLVAKRTLTCVPDKILSHTEFKPKLNISWFIKTAKQTFCTDCFLCKNIPHVKPMQNAVSVIPGKYVPNGSNIAPIISDNPATTPVRTGPNTIADITIGTNEKPILAIGVFIDKNLVNTISVAIRIAISVIVFVLNDVVFCIKNPFHVSHKKNIPFKAVDATDNRKIIFSSLGDIPSQGT